ncbi:MAG: hypothetical protein IJL00_03580 [Clostridia bacterium]|jgi:hypothetical protein|nr:hypothetical protein [Clostridia bacterium]
MQRNDTHEMNEKLNGAAALAIEDALAGDGLPDAEGIDALLDLLEETGALELPPEEDLQRQQQQTLHRLRRKRRLAPRRLLAAAAAFVVLCTAAVLGAMQQTGRIDLLPSFSVTEPGAPASMQVEDLLESLSAHSFRDVALSQVFLQEGWTATAPTYYNEGGKRCADFQVYRADACYCFSLKAGEAPPEDYAALGAERVVTIEKEVVVYVFGGEADMSEMRYRLNDLTYSVTANVPEQTMIHTANQIEKA